MTRHNMALVSFGVSLYNNPFQAIRINVLQTGTITNLVSF